MLAALQGHILGKLEGKVARYSTVFCLIRPKPTIHRQSRLNRASQTANRLIRLDPAGDPSDMTSEIREEIENNVSVPSDKPAALTFSSVNELEDASQHIPVHFLLRSDDEMYGLHDIVKPLPGSNLTESTTHLIKRFKIKRRFKEGVKVNKIHSNESEKEKTENIIGKQDGADPMVFSDKQTNTSFLQQVIKEIEHDRCKPISKNGKGDNLPKLTPSSSNKSSLSSKTSLLHNLMNSQQKPHKCEACGKGFITPSKLERHNLIHSGEKPHRCEECGRCFSQVSHLRGHLLVHSAQINDKLGTTSPATIKLIHGLFQNQQKQYKCEECGKGFVTRSKLNRHGFRHTGQKPHKCDVCGKYFGDVGNLRQHLVIHSGIKPYKCEVCEEPEAARRCPQRTTLLRECGLFYFVQSQRCTQGEGYDLQDESESSPPHSPLSDGGASTVDGNHTVLSGDESIANIMEPKIEILEKCEDCGKLFKTKENLATHRLVHNKQYNCNECGKSFLFTNSLADHACTRNKTERHKCEECGKCFSKSSNLNQHRLTHNGPNEFVCKECGKGFKMKSYLIKHNFIHEGQKPHKCTECDKRFASRDRLERHRIIHSGRKPYICDVCGRCFNQVCNLNYHYLIHTREHEGKCEDCGQCFNDGLSLNQHRLFHCSEKPYRCEYCGKCFKSNSSICQHRLTHSENKKYMCEECGKCFKILAALNQHRLTHRGYRPHTCEECGKGFALRSQLSRHWLVHAKHKT
uniref:C2H2-type domain-containing protein n=1 Tax=Timema genevievae TaxID=629358 RepID=A0A7R9PQJ8_TIMGE|nr:unnamed protein product [Timema genevievae]